MADLTKRQQKAENIRTNEAKRHLKQLRLFAARNLIKICDGDLAGALKALIKSYGHLYGKNEPEQALEAWESVIHSFDTALEQAR